MRRFVACAGPALACALIAAAAAAAGQPENPFDRIVPLVRIGDRLPATTFVDQTGRPIALAAARGDALAVAFIYTRCKDACPIVTRKLGAARALLNGVRARIVEVTIDPRHDDPRTMATYARDNGMDAPRWLALTGRPADVEDFDRRMGVQALATGRDTILHDDRIAVVSPDGVVDDVIEGSSWTSADLAAELRHESGAPASALGRIDLALGAAVAFCGGALAGRAGIGDAIASFAVIGAFIGIFIWVVRRTAEGR